jgi:hypothetical protein
MILIGYLTPPLQEYMSATSITEPTRDTAIEPKQPRRLEKNTNMTRLYIRMTAPEVD